MKHTASLRRSRAEIQDLKEAMYRLLAASHPMTVRQVFYALVARGHIAKTETEYKHTVVRLLVEMRKAGELPYGWLADSTRWMRKPQTYDSLRAMLAITAETYRRALWVTQPDYVEIWLEKEALAGVVYEITALYDVPLMVTRGYPSLSFLYEAAEAMAAVGKPVYVYYFGDFDPSGVDIARQVRAALTDYAPVPLTFERVAVTPEQIVAWNLPTRPTKRTDSRARHFGARDSVEVDAIPADRLRALVEDCIVRHLDLEELRKLEQIEQEERQLLVRFAESLVSGEAASPRLFRRSRRSARSRPA